jgi:signal transduction histidine kinase
VTIGATLGWVVVAMLAARCARTGRRLELVADAEHELRGALTAFGLAIERAPGGAAGRRAAQMLESELDRARAALDDLAQARGRRAPARRPDLVPLDRLARSAAAAWRPAARLVGRRVELDWRAGPVRVRADRGRLAQAFGNLMANAVEHGAGPVRIVARRRGGAVRVEVVNALPATPATASEATRRSRGRGLAIASRAVERCGGDLTVDATAERARAAIELPVAR